MMGRLMAFIVVVVCTAQVVLLRAQERTEQPRTEEPALDTSNPRFAYHKIDDGYLRLDLRSGEVATCRPQSRWLDLHARARGAHRARERDRTAAARQCAPEERATGARLWRCRCRAPTPRRATPEAAPPRPPAPIPPQADAGEHRQAEIDRVIATMERWWRRVVELAATIQRDLQGKD